MHDNADELLKEAIAEDDYHQIKIYRETILPPNFDIHKGADDSWDKDFPSSADVDSNK